MMFAQPSALWAFALIALSCVLTAVSALPEDLIVTVANPPALRHSHNATIGWNVTSDYAPGHPLVTIISPPETTSHPINSTIATSSTLQFSFPELSSQPSLSLSGPLFNFTDVRTNSESKAASLALSSRPATASFTSSASSCRSSLVDYTTMKIFSEGKPAAPSSSSSSSLATETFAVSVVPSYVDAMTTTSFARGYKPTSSSSSSSLTDTDHVTLSRVLSVDKSIATLTVRGHTVLLLPAPTDSASTTKHYASPTPWIETKNTTLYPNPEKVKKIAGICIGSSVAAGGLSFTIKKGVWMALEKAQRVHPDWSKTKVIDYLIRGSHSTDSSWSSESTDSSDFSDSSDSSDSSWNAFPPLTDIEGRALAQVESFLIQEEVQNPGSVFEPEPAEQVRSEIGEDAWGEPFAPPGPIDQPLPTALERGKVTGEDKETQKATGSGAISDYKTSWYSKTFDPATATADPQDASTATITTLINGNTVLILPPGATRAPLRLPAVKQDTPWKVERGQVSNATASDGNITGYIPPEDNSRALAATVVAPVLGVPAAFVISYGIYKAIREWVYHDGAIKKVEEAKNLADVMDKMIRVQEKIPLSLEEGNEIDQIENFLMMRESYNPGGTYTRDEMNQIGKVLGKDAMGFWKKPTIKDLPKETTFFVRHGESNLFGKYGQERPAPRPWPKKWGPAPPGLTSEEPDGPDPNSPETDPPEPSDGYTMSGGLGDPPPDDEPPPDGVHGGPPHAPWRWIPDSPDPDDGPDHDGSRLQSPTPESKPKKSVHWQTPLTSIIPTSKPKKPKKTGRKAGDGGPDDKNLSDHGSNDDAPTNEPTSLQTTMPTSMSSSAPTTTVEIVFKTDVHRTSTLDIGTVKIVGKPTSTQLQIPTKQNVTTAGQPTTSPSLNANGPSESATGQSTTVPTLTGLCTAGDCMSSRRPTPTEHDSVWLHYMSLMHPECSSYEERGTCLSSGQPTPTRDRTVWSYHVELTNMPPTPTPSPPRSTVIVHTMVKITVTTGAVHSEVTVAAPAPPPPPPPPPPRPRRHLCGGDYWTDCCVYRYGRQDGLMDCFDGPLPHKHHMNPPCHDGKHTDCCIYRKGVAMRCSPT